MFILNRDHFKGEYYYFISVITYGETPAMYDVHCTTYNVRAKY